jgi:hypothetical protein
VQCRIADPNLGWHSLSPRNPSHEAFRVFLERPYTRIAPPLKDGLLTLGGRSLAKAPAAMAENARNLEVRDSNAP